MEGRGQWKGQNQEREMLRDEHCKVKDRDLRLGVM